MTSPARTNAISSCIVCVALFFGGCEPSEDGNTAPTNVPPSPAATEPEADLAGPSASAGAPAARNPKGEKDTHEHAAQPEPATPGAKAPTASPPTQMPKSAMEHKPKPEPRRKKAVSPKAPSVTCEDGKYQAGDKWKRECNDCYCTEKGKAMCSRKACNTEIAPKPN